MSLSNLPAGVTEKEVSDSVIGEGEMARILELNNITQEQYDAMTWHEQEMAQINYLL